MKVYDCFTFYNEFELLELRLKSLWEMVDYFVLVEADRTQNNKPKPFYFAESMEEFKEFLPKIRHIPLEVNVDYKGTGDWQIENGQRDGILYGLEDAEPDDLIFISDVDEIPAPDILQRITENRVPLMTQCNVEIPTGNKNLRVPCQVLVPAAEILEHVPIALVQSFHYYYLDWVSNIMWQGTVLVKRKNLTTPQNIRYLSRFTNKLLYIPNSGWHFSYMGGVDKIIAKMTAIVEGDELISANKNLTDKNYIRECMRTGRDIYGRKNISAEQFYPYDISEIDLPYLKDFVEKYPYFLRKYDFGEFYGKDDL